MERDYNNGEASNVEYFIGEEIENTQFKGMKTLFVAKSVNLNEIALILRDHPDVKHVYLGANHYYQNVSSFVEHGIGAIYKLTECGINVTLDIPHDLLQTTLKYIDLQDIFDSPNVCLMVSIRMPNIEKLSSVRLKIDDSDYKGTNPGVWVLSTKDLPTHTFNDWSKYQNDGPVKPKLI